MDGLISSGLAISGFIIGSTSFLMTIYLRRYKIGTPSQELRPYIYLIVSQIMLPAILTFIMLSVVIMSDQIFYVKLVYSVSLCLLYFPIIAFAYLLSRNWPKETTA